MYNGIGLATARGSGTNGYVQKNLSAVRKQQYRKNDNALASAPEHKKPNEDILLFEKKKQIEIEVMKLEDSLIDDGVEEDFIQEKCDLLRSELFLKLDTMTKNLKDIKAHQQHELAAAKELKNEAFKNAFKIRNDYDEGDVFCQVIMTGFQ